jgi:hypothetical protein
MMTHTMVVVCLAQAGMSPLIGKVPLVSSSGASLPRPHVVPGPDVSRNRTALMLRQP